MTRLYYWFLGAPANRPGGAWWYKDFEDRCALDHYLVGLKPFLEAYSISTNVVELHPMDIRPQPGDSIISVRR